MVTHCDEDISQRREFEAAARVIQAGWRMLPRRREVAQQWESHTQSVYGEKPQQAPTHACGEVEQRQALMQAMSQREDHGHGQSSCSEDEEADNTEQRHLPHKILTGDSSAKPTQNGSRPDLSGDWLFSFEGTLHSWHVRGTIAHTPDGADEDGEQLEIVEEDGREMLNGWSLIGRSNDKNLMLWEDSESYERVIWVRAGHRLEDSLDTMEDDVTVSVVDITTGNPFCSLVAEKTWLVFDLMEAIQDQVGIQPREQRLAIQGRQLTREDEPLIDVLPATSGEAAVVVCAKVPSSGRQSASGISAPDETMPRRPSLREIDEAARCLQNTVLATIRQDPDALRHAPEDVASDRDLVLAAVREGATLSSLLPEFQADKEIVVAAVQRDGMALQHASPLLQEDREVVLTATKQDARALKFSASTLQNDSELRGVATAEVEDDGLACNMQEQQPQHAPESPTAEDKCGQAVTINSRHQGLQDLTASDEWDPDASFGASDDKQIADEPRAAMDDTSEDAKGDADKSWSGYNEETAWDPDAQDGAWTEDAPEKAFADVSPVLGVGESTESRQTGTVESSSNLQVPKQADGETSSSVGSRALTPREIIQEQNAEFQESELIDAKKAMDVRVKFFTAEVAKKELELQDSEDALRNATGRLERYGENPRVEEERDMAQAKVVEATASLAERHAQLAKCLAAVETLDAELVAMSTDIPDDEMEF
jgi:hypothetical protein